MALVNGNTQAVEKQSPVKEAQNSRAISTVSVNVDRLTSYKLRSIEEYALTADTNILAIQEVGSKGAEYLGRASFSRLNRFTTDISKNKDKEQKENQYFSNIFEQEHEQRSRRSIKTKLNSRSYYIINIYAPHAGKTAKEYIPFLIRLQKAISLKRKKRPHNDPRRLERSNTTQRSDKQWKLWIHDKNEQECKKHFGTI
eukprot:snap_masked-scaffold_1-processed-gene-0.12-mRNA-1 protein AED:1.00 eAED:1.00 QI:0/0/0/0/1/1/3/0/198